MQVYVGQIICAGFNFAPAGWAFCDGSLLPIDQNQALFQLIGTTYGGDGQTTFALPDLRGRTPVGTGRLAGGSNYSLGETGGAEQVTLQLQNYPLHTHPLTATSTNGNANAPAGNFLAGGQSIYESNAPLAADALNAAAVTPYVGGNVPHSNLQPFLTCNWIISLFGIFPSQS
jgi:microcystin-dependent protein